MRHTYTHRHTHTEKIEIFLFRGMTRGNQRETARLKNLKAKEDAKKREARSNLNNNTMTIICKVCKQCFMCTSIKSILQQHVDAKHPKLQITDC